MKKYKTILVFSIFVFLSKSIASQNNVKHFISDKDYRVQVTKDFESLKSLTRHRADVLYNVFSDNISLEEKEALQFLYAYMPISDLADYDGAFFLKHVKMSLLAKETFSWGKTIPEDVFRHFVLPIRINNENLDTARIVFFNELKDRVKNLSLYDAALEVNHWCHEKVTYKGTDGRTSAPLSTVKTAYGRCGEESTLTVTALRSVGIPARQVYTPRWAHCDDNHAWVEVWVDNKWYFMGACEPEPELNVAWFSAPVLRAMMCNTTVFGRYSGGEEKLKSSDKFTQINLLSNYTPVKQIFIKIIDQKNQPVENAMVEFQLYNYAEFYPIAKKTTNADGLASLFTGLGDLFIWSYKDNRYGFEKITVEKTDTVKIVIWKQDLNKKKFQWVFVPPVQRQPKIVELKGKLINEIRLKKEDSIRNAYERTFIDSVLCSEIAIKSNLNADSVWRFVKLSRGNWDEILRFILKGVQVSRSKTFKLLESISEKDLRDTPEQILTQHLLLSKELYCQTMNYPVEFFWKYVLNPRISGELLTPYKKIIQEDKTAGILQTPESVINYVKQNIETTSLVNYSRNPLTPVGTHNLKYADETSRDIYFVAVCRSLGFPAQINPVTKKPEYYSGKGWIEVVFEHTYPKISQSAIINVNYDQKSVEFKPVYYTHFTIARLINGVYVTLDYEENPVFKSYPSKIQVDTGMYMVVTGVRNSDGSVNTVVEFFNLDVNQQKNINLDFTVNSQKPNSMGTIPEGLVFKPLEKNNAGNKDLPLTVKGTPVIIAWIKPGTEPTRHAMVDLNNLKQYFEQWKGNMVLLLPKNTDVNNFNPQSLPDLPNQTILGVDDFLVYEILSKKIRGFSIDDLPVFIAADASGSVLYYSSGYKIGLGEQLLKLLKFLN